ncbi:MAG: hypothetical protein GXY27_03700 [Erysipelotrichaceae bacterium]|nr:hypothetical protein [Erysipelotrichaceae bacterium]
MWHSTDKYRRIIFQCNSKFANEKKCETPMFTEEQIKVAFLASFNQFDKTSTIEDLELTIKVLNDNTRIDKKLINLEVETNAIVAVFDKRIKDNLEKALNQDDYSSKWLSLKDKYDALVAQANKLREEKKNKATLINHIKLFIIALKDNKDLVSAFSNKLWTTLIESVSVNKDGTLRFRYYSGLTNIVHK